MQKKELGYSLLSPYEEKIREVSADAKQIVTSWRQKRTLMIQLGNHGIVEQKKGVSVSHAQAPITNCPPMPPPSSHNFSGFCGSRCGLQRGYERKYFSDPRLKEPLYSCKGAIAP